MMQKYYNVPLKELMEIIDHALKNGYSVIWDGDYTERSYNPFIGIATIPNEEIQAMEKWDLQRAMAAPHEGMEITQKLRQEAFDDQRTTDDHLMHITGMSKDQSGTKFYLTKNSMGEKVGPYNGYIYLSEAYVKYKTVAIMVHKDALPEKISEKLKIH